VQVVGQSLGKLVKGNILVSNFNNSANQQGTGRTIVELDPYGHLSVFATVYLPYKAPVGLTTALEILPDGFVLVGNLPTYQGTLTPASKGSLIILDRWGHVVENLTAPWINGPWDSYAQNYGDHGDNTSVYFTNVLNGGVAYANGAVVNKGTIVRLDLDTDPGYAPRVTRATQIGSGFAERTDPAALIVGPTGVALSDTGTLYVADSVNSLIRGIPAANTRLSDDGHGYQVTPDSDALNAPLGMVIAPNNNIITVNGLDGKAVETAPNGMQVTWKFLDTSGGPPPGNGALFGIALAPYGHGLYFVDDATNQLDLLH
jgi:hypothetical protein